MWTGDAFGYYVSIRVAGSAPHSGAIELTYDVWAHKTHKEEGRSWTMSAQAPLRTEAIEWWAGQRGVQKRK